MSQDNEVQDELKQQSEDNTLIINKRDQKELVHLLGMACASVEEKEDWDKTPWYPEAKTLLRSIAYNYLIGE